MLEKIKYIFVDVDGTLTDSGIYYDENGNELKKFSTRDAAGFFAARAVGIKMIVLTGRECRATERRVKELKAERLYQSIKDKAGFLAEFMKNNSISADEIGYIGDDLNDLLPMRMAGFKACPADSCKEIKDAADYVGKTCGGSGAVREIVEYILKERNEWDKAIAAIL